MSTTIEDLCRGFPFEFVTYLKQCRGLRFEEGPDYNFLRQLFRKLYRRHFERYDFQFDWKDPDLLRNREIQRMKEKKMFEKERDRDQPFPSSVNTRRQSTSIQNRTTSGQNSHLLGSSGHRHHHHDRDRHTSPHSKNFEDSAQGDYSYRSKILSKTKGRHQPNSSIQAVPGTRTGSRITPTDELTMTTSGKPSIRSSIENRKSRGSGEKEHKSKK